MSISNYKSHEQAITSCDKLLSPEMIPNLKGERVLKPTVKCAIVLKIIRKHKRWVYGKFPSVFHWGSCADWCEMQVGRGDC